MNNRIIGFKGNVAAPIEYPTISIKSGLLNCYEFDEAPGSTVLIDKHGSNHCIYGSTVQLDQDAGLLSKSAFFDGASASDINWNNVLLGKDEFTISVWVKKHAFIQYGSLIADYHTTVNKRNLILGYESVEEIIRFYVGNGATAASVGIGGYTEGWHHIIATFKSSINLQRIFLDMAYETASPVVSTMGSSQTSYSRIGAYYFYEMKGHITQLAIWDRALTSQNMADLNNNTLGVPYANWI